ncbi:hypothetical protein ONS96_000649 [Cadophora gregata f. sp. sojae]|nr:hypothetical protein ONS96_000649 [Cadophora gregata f. sp. sojae]
MLIRSLLKHNASVLVTQPKTATGSTVVSVHSVQDERFDETRTQRLVGLCRRKACLASLLPQNSHGGWKPVTLRSPILGVFVLISIIMIAALEVLSHISSQDGNGGGLVFATNVESISTAASFGYLYFPTILAVCYSMIWSWVDLDVKRLEPWFQLSKSKGAQAQNSLLLQYPFDFLPFVPLSALKRRHWSVFLAGTIMLVVFWAITPLQSAIFNTGVVTRSKHIDMGTTATLVSLDRQAHVLNANFLNVAYAISWLGQKLPGFTTANYTVLPFGPTTLVQRSLPSETWTAARDAFGTSISCSPAIVEVEKLGYTFRNGKGCSVSQINLPVSHDFGSHMINYIGYFSNPHVDWSLQNPNCTAEFSNNFLALYASGKSHVQGGIYSNITALFCETSYSSHSVTVTVNASDNTIVHQKLAYQSRSSSGAQSIQGILNTTAFEYVLATGVNPTNQKVNLPDRAVLEQYPRLMKYNLTWPVSNMVGFAVALNPSRVDDLAESTALKVAFERAHQLLFTTAFNSLLEPVTETNSSDSVAGLLEDSPGAIILVRPVAIAVEIALAIVAIMTLLLWFHSHSRQSSLETDPSSIADLMAVLQAGQISRKESHSTMDFARTTVDEGLSQEVYCLTTRIPGEKVNAQAERARDLPFGSSTTIQSTSGHDEIPPLRPVELRIWSGAAFVIVLGTAIIGLTVLNSQILKHNGLTLPSSNPTVLSIIENYVPTIFATLLEPIWIVLNRHLCLLKPFDELRKGNAMSARSVEARYTSLPPPLIVWRALRSGHFLLAAVCLTVISSNFLAVSLSTLINEGQTTANYSFTSERQLLPNFNNTRIRIDGIGGPAISYFDHFYIEMSNITSNTTLPPWVDAANYYLPFTPGNANQISNNDISAVLKGFKGTTTGFGAQVNCNSLSQNEEIDGYEFKTSEDGLTAFLSTSHQLPNGTRTTCVSLAVTNALNETIGFRSNFPTGNIGLEVMQSMFPAKGLDDGGFCSSLLVAGWVRASSIVVFDLETGAINSTQIANVSSTFLSCTATVETSNFDVVVDTTGRIVSSNRTSLFTANKTSLFSGNGSTELSLFQETVDLLAPVMAKRFQWHNTSVTSDWMNSLLAIELNSQRLVDPAASAPNGSEITPMVKQLYTKLFAILLGLNSDRVFAHSSVQASEPFEEIIEVSRIFLSPPMLIVSVTILVFHLVMAIIYYMYRPRNFLPRMPTSLAAIFSYVYASRAIQDFSYTRKESGDKNAGQRFGYGRFVGIDGKTHVGIEQQRFVVPLKSRNPEVRKRKWARTFEREDERQPKTWI